jgi:hypothetical protein
MRKVIQLGPAEESDEAPERAGKKKIVQIGTAGERASQG